MITIDVQDQEIHSYLQQLSGKLTDMTPVMGAIGMELEGRVSDRFESTADPDGSQWEPHPVLGYPWEYDARYPSDGNRRLLNRSGDMLESLSYQADRDSVLVGFGQPYAAFHEYGTKYMQRRGMLFADPVAGTLGQDDQQSILDILRQHLA